jgi:hypothetical protein
MLPELSDLCFWGKSGHLADLPRRLLTIEMLKLPPPIWALVYVLTASAISWFFGWSKVSGFPLVSLGISLVAISWILPFWAIVLFRREGTEVEPTSPTNRNESDVRANRSQSPAVASGV